MAKHYTSRKAICPFYKYENRQVIYCEGIEDGAAIHLAFANPADCLAYKKAYCRCDCSLCLINEMLMVKYDGGE